MMTRLKRLLAGARGSEIAEAALVFPIAFLILLSIYWFGRAFNVYATINHAAREGARYAVSQSCASCGNAPPSVTDVAKQVKQALQAAHLDPSSVTPGTTVHTACPGQTMTCTTPASPQIKYCTNVQLVPPPLNLPAASGTPPCGVSIDFRYPYQMFLPGTSLNKKQFQLSAHVQMRAEQ